MDAIVGSREWRARKRTMKMKMLTHLVTLFCSIISITNAQRAAQTNATSSYSPSSSFQPHVSYLIIASKVIRPNTLYKLVVILLEDSVACRVSGSISRNGVAIATNSVEVFATQSASLILDVPPDTTGAAAAAAAATTDSASNVADSRYRLRVEGVMLKGGNGGRARASGGIVFEHEQPLQFSRKFLSILISTNKVIFNAEHIVRIRVLMLTTALRPYEGIADLYMIDPDGFIIRKWNSKELNVGVLTEEFELPLYPKVGFWTIRVLADGQIEEKKIKVEKHYLPLGFELVVSMPNFALDTEDTLEASVEGAFITERLAKGSMHVRWMAKKIDYQTPMFNDSVVYREEYKYRSKIDNVYRNSRYNNELPIQSDDQWPKRRDNNPFLDLYANSSFAPKKPLSQNWTYIRSDFRVFRFNEGAPEPFALFLDEVETVMGRRSGLQVRLEAQFTEYFYNNTQHAFAETRLISQKLKMHFLGDPPFAFKPGMPFFGQVAVMYDDLVPLSEDTLSASSITIVPVVRIRSGSTMALNAIRVPTVEDEKIEAELFDDYNDIDDFDGTDDADSTSSRRQLASYAVRSSYGEFRRSGVHQFRLDDVPYDAALLRIVATFAHPELGERRAEADAYSAYGSETGRHVVSVWCSTKTIRVGEYAIFHAKTSFAFSHVDWLIVSKDMILLSGRELGENVHPEVVTFSVAVSSQMAPAFHMLVHAQTSRGEIVSDSVYLPVEAIKRHEIELSTNQVKDHKQETVEVTCRGDPGSVFLAATMRESLFPQQGLYTITKTNLLERLHKFEGGGERSRVHKTRRTSREGETPDEIRYYPSMERHLDTARSFEEKNLVTFTNVLRPTMSEAAKECDADRGEVPCLSSGCVLREELCDGKRDCEDGFDESGCGDAEQRAMEQLQAYRLSRQSRFEDFYDVGDGDWGWITANIDEDGEQFVNLVLPETPDDFYFHVFSMSKENGIGILDPPPSYSTTRPVDFYCEAPEQVRRGESVGIRCNILNRTPYELEAVVMLRGSEDHSFIHVEQYGYVTSYAPRTSKGDHHHFLWLRPESEVEVLTPIAIHLQKGTVDATLQLSTQVTMVTQVVSIEVRPEGSHVHRHTAMLLDLKNRANVIRFMNVIVDETPVIPYEVYRRYISGSPKAHVTLSGDVIGPIFPGDEPVSLRTMFPSGNGRYGKGTDYHAFNLAANTWQLHYLRLTNQLNEEDGSKYRDVAKAVFEQMNVEYTAVMRRFSGHGHFKNWDNAEPSVWLTAWVVRIFTDVSFQDWEDFIYIDPKVVTSAVLWLLNYQTQEGAFVETEAYAESPFHRPTSPDPARDSYRKNETYIARHAALTAHVLIALEETASALIGNAKQYSATGRQRAVSYLERNLPHITSDAYALAITCHALALSKSSVADLAYGHLMSAAREEGGMVYWGRSDITTNRVRYEFNRPFVEAKDYQENDALAVEATGFALQTIFLMEGGGVTFTQDKAVQWLNSMRLGDGGFVSTVDTIVALRALVTYSYHSRIKDITKLTVEVDLPDSNFTATNLITGQNIADGLRIDLENVWGHVNLYAAGAGQAVAQLDVTYGVDYEPFKDQPPSDCFRLSIRENFHGRNKSEVTIRSCFSWTLLHEAPTSGIALLEVDIPSGYVLEQPDADAIVRSNVVPEMKDAIANEYAGKTIWFFDRVPNETRCFEHTVRRYFPVANLTRTRQAVLIEPLRPERFTVRTFNATSLYILSICEVCGSYQCPYCPFYSSAPPHPFISPATLAAAAALLLVITHEIVG